MIRVMTRALNDTVCTRDFEADSFYFTDGILWLVAAGPDHEQVAAIPQERVLSAEKIACCSHA